MNIKMAQKREQTGTRIIGSRYTYEEMYPTNHLFFLRPSNPFRRFCAIVSTSKPFEIFIMLAIVYNCFMMAINSPLPGNDQSELNKTIEKMEIYLLGIFIGEAFLKIIAQGILLHPDAYLRSAWNLLDLTVVVTGILGMPELGLGQQAGSMKVIKAARVLRPLKLVSGIPSLQVVMSAIIKSMASLLQICLLIGFVILMYAIIGLSFLIGKFHSACYYKNSTILYENGLLCGAQECPADLNLECREYWGGPDNGITSFDNILIACLTVFVCITCEGWTNTMYYTFQVQDANGYYVWLYYYTMNIIGAQFMLNLVCGVLAGEFSQEKDRSESRRKFFEARAAEKYEDWVDKGVLKKQTEEDEQLLTEEKEDDDDDGDPDEIVQERPIKQVTLFQTLKKKHRIFRLKLRDVMLSSFMNWLVIFLVLCNSLSGAIQHYRQPQWITDVITISDYIFISFFFTEMVLKIYSMGPKAYFAKSFNKFDCVVVIGGIFNLISSKVFNLNFAIPVLRQLRLMKLFKYTRYWHAMKNLVKSIFESMAAILSLLVLLSLFLIIFALLGMQLFGGTFHMESRTNFDDFFNAMLAVFQIITGEDWNFVMYEGVVAYGGPRTVKGLAVSLYFVGVTVLGNYVLLNVFLAIAVDNLSMDDQDKEIIAEEKKHMEEIRETFAPADVAASTSGQADHETNSGTDEVDDAEEDQDDKCSNSDQESDVGEFDSGPNEGGKYEPGEGFLENLKNPGRMTGNISSAAGSLMLQENNLFICYPNNPIRKAVHWLVSSRYFDNIILVLILISSSLLAAEDVTNPKATINQWLIYFDFVFTSIFALEVILKIINFGLILHKGSYCRDSWNCIDMFVVICAVTSLVLSHNEDTSPKVQQVVKILRILRVLRPLKSINKLPKLKAVFQCMIFSLKNVFNIIIIILQFLFIFSVAGVQLFSGKLYYCNDQSKEWEDECQGYYITYEKFNYNRPKEVPREWDVYDFNFDDIFKAMLSLFTSSTGEGWPAIMQTGIDSQNEGQGPIINSKIWISLYFIIFVVIFSFFFINVFVGMIILTFQEQGAAAADSELNRNAKNSLKFAMLSRPVERFMPDDVKSLQYKTWFLIESTTWEITIMALILLNTIVLMMEFYDQPKEYADILSIINDAFTFIFLVEFFVKIFALKCNYFRDAWNVFDLLIVLGSLLGFASMKFLPPKAFRFDPSIFRLFRAARLVKLLRRSRSLRILLWTFFQSFKALPYVGMLIFLLFFVYGIIGMQIFSNISVENDKEPWLQISTDNHFRSYFAATQVLFRVATGENWPNIMLACTAKAECDLKLPSVTSGQVYCGTDMAYLYFISFVFFCSFLMLNLFIAVIMDSFAFLTEDSSILGPHHLDEFATVWSEFDPRARGRIHHTEMHEFLGKMMPPVGLGPRCSNTIVYKRLVQMNMTLYKDGTVDYTATLFALVRTALSLHTDQANLLTTDAALRKMLKDTWPNISKRTLRLVIPRPPRNCNQMTVGKIYAARLMYDKYRLSSGSIKNIKNGNGLVQVDQSNGNTSNTSPVTSIQISSPKSPSIPLHPLSDFRTPTYSPVVVKRRQEIAMAIRNGKNPYELRGLTDSQENEDEWT